MAASRFPVGRGLFVGGKEQLIREIPFNAIQFTVYEVGVVGQGAGLNGTAIALRLPLLAQVRGSSNVWFSRRVFRSLSSNLT